MAEAMRCEAFAVVSGHYHAILSNAANRARGHPSAFAIVAHGGEKRRGGLYISPKLEVFAVCGLYRRGELNIVRFFVSAFALNIEYRVIS